ncbi:hypothetical protein [Humibacter sp.]|uniref:hypothetical protein n=1 Tax=Humibacter sp. TaxID=1940291 RepID=UPI003F7CEECF
MAEMNEKSLKDGVDDAADKAHGAVDEAAGTVSERMSDASRSASRGVGEASGAAHDMVDDAQRKVSRGLDQADASLDDMRDTAVETTRENPLKVILMVAAIAAAVGFVVGMASSRRS